MSDALREIVAGHNHVGGGIYSVCSAHPTVLRAAALQAREDDTLLLVEATSNQVDQFGGYTGLTPAGFRELVESITDEVGLPSQRVILGGDHLGPNRWTQRPAEEAMALAVTLVTQYVAAGYTKIHLDCSMRCADDPPELSDSIVAERSATLMGAAEGAIRSGGEAPSYVIGTEVPPPGGARHDILDLQPTPVSSAERTLQTHKAVFDARGLGPVWERVVALVVQPGVEFDHDKVVDYRRQAAVELSQSVSGMGGLVFEAHSTDYQTLSNLRALVEDHWAILKVGPGLTFALREALFGLDAIDRELADDSTSGKFRAALESAMVSDPVWWEGHYPGTVPQQRLARAYSYSDRARYYLPQAPVAAAVEELIERLGSRRIPETLLSQFLPTQYARVRAGQLECEPGELLIDHVRDVLRTYAAATTSSVPRAAD